MLSLGEMTSGVLAAIDEKIAAFAETSFRALTDPASDLMAMLLVLALMHLSLSVAMGWVSATVSGIIRLVIRYAFIWGVLASWPAFETWFYSVVTGTPDDIVKIVIRSTNLDPEAAGITAIIERFIDAGVSLGDMLVENVSISTIALVMIGIVILFLMLGLSSAVILVIGISKIGIGVTTAVAPVFLMMLLFQGTKGFFDGWLRLTVSFAVTYLMAMVMLGFLLFVTEETIARYASLEFVDRVADITEYLLIVILSIFMLKQIPSFGASVAGSAAIGIDGISKVVRGTTGAWNRAHGLRADGRTNYGAINRRAQRQRVGEWAKRQISKVTSPADTPAQARRDAAETAKRKASVDAARPAARAALRSATRKDQSDTTRNNT